MSCFCGRSALQSGFCPYHDENCVKDPKCRKRLVFTPVCEMCHLPGGEVYGVAPRLRGAKIYGPLLIDTVAGDVDLSEARGRDLVVHNVRGKVRLSSARFRHIYVDLVLGDVELAGGKTQSLVVSRLEGKLSLGGTYVGGNVAVFDTKGRIDGRGAEVVGEVVVDGHRGDVALGVRAYSITVARLRGSLDLSSAEVEGDVYVVECEGERLDLSGASIGGRLYILASRFSGVRIDKADNLKKAVVMQ